MNYLKKFNTTAEYGVYIDNAEALLPNVSLTMDDNSLHYTPVPLREYVEIGGVKWATMNVGARTVTDCGLYFQWGDTRGYADASVKAFKWSEYKFNPSGDGVTFTKYNETDSLTVLENVDDGVNFAWNGSWRMPTGSEFQSLSNAVDAVWTDDYQESGVSGLVCTDKTDSKKVLFFPACGFCDNRTLNGVGTGGHYWSSTLNTTTNKNANRLFFDNSGTITWQRNTARYIGFCLRGVLDE